MSYNFTTTPYDELTAADKKRVHKLQLKDQLTDIQAAFKGVLEARAELKRATAKYLNSRDQFSDDYINSTNRGGEKAPLMLLIRSTTIKRPGR